MNRGIYVSNAVMLIMGFLAVYSYMGPEGLSLYWCMLVGLATGSIIGPIDDVISGLFVGAMAVFYFCALTMRGVSTGAFEIANEVRRQFREIKGLLEGEAAPDYVACVDIATQRALRAMVLPGLLVIIIPLVTGVILGPQAVAGVLIGSLLVGLPLAIMMTNSGGAWDNAKKHIEAGNLGGKGSEAHKAAVIGDTVGDPFKDTLGPSLDILIKLVGKMAVIFAPLFGVLVVL